MTTHKCYYSSFEEISSSKSENLGGMIDRLVWAEQNGSDFDTNCDSYNIEQKYSG